MLINKYMRVIRIGYVILYEKRVSAKTVITGSTLPVKKKKSGFKKKLEKSQLS